MTPDRWTRSNRESAGVRAETGPVWHVGGLGPNGSLPPRARVLSGWVRTMGVVGTDPPKTA